MVTLVDLFDAHVIASPTAVAVRDATKVLTYADLDSAACVVANELVDAGVAAETIVGIVAGRSAEMIVGILGILKSGASYLPIDPTLPLARIGGMLREAEPAAVVVDESTLHVPGSAGFAGTIVTANARVTRGPLRAALGRIRSAADAAYTMYTSGTTGAPKGVVVEHRNVVSLLEATSHFAFGPADVWTLIHNYAFDFSVWEMWGALAYGGELVVVNEQTARNPQAFASLLCEHDVTVLNQTPSSFRALAELDPSMPPSLRLIILGGEPIELPTLRRWRRRHPSGPRLVNMFGITETTIHTTWLDLRDEHLEWVGAGTPIGEPLPGMTLRVLDPTSLRPAKIGETGELFVAGSGVARGYFKNPRLTAERFVPDPESGLTMYRSGDFGFQDREVGFVHVGRNDRQVKLRGFRVELTEIETSLDRTRGVEKGVALVRGDGARATLAAFVVPNREEAAPVRRSLELAASSPVVAAALTEAPNGMLIAAANPGETSFLFDEIVARRAYVRHGIAVPDNAIILDVGANIGVFSLWVAEQADSISVYAFEPMPETWRLLRANFDIHGLSGMAFNVALGARNEMAYFSYFPHNTIFSGRYAGEEERIIAAELLRRESPGMSKLTLAESLDSRMGASTIRCRVRPLSDVISELKLKKIDLLKIDVEKAELEVLAGIADAQWPMIEQVVVEAHSDRIAEELSVCLSGRGYEVMTSEAEALTGSGLRSVFARRCPLREGQRRSRANFSGATSFEAHVRSELARELPTYAQPSRIHLVPGFPLTANGKIDYATLENALPLHHAQRGPQLAGTEAIVASTMSAVLECKVARAEDDFFELGGQSLTAVVVVRHLRSIFGTDIPLELLFEKPRVADLSAALDDRVRERHSREQRYRLGSVSGDHQTTPDASGALLPAQEHMLAFQRLFPDSHALNVGRLVRFIGGLRTAWVRKCVIAASRRHPFLTATFPITDREASPVFGVITPRVVTIEQSEDWDVIIRREVSRPFALESDGTARFFISRRAPGDIQLLIVMHHVVIDATSMNLFLEEVVAEVEGATQRCSHTQPVAYAPPALEADGDAGTSSSVLIAGREYWTRVLKDASPLSPQIGRNPRPFPLLASASTSTTMAFEPACLPAVSRRLGLSVTPQSFLLGAFAKAVLSVSGSDAVTIAVPCERRPRADAQTVACYVELAPVCVAAGADDRLLQDVQRQIVHLLEYGPPPVDVAPAGARRLAGHHPYMNVAFLYFDAPLHHEQRLQDGTVVVVDEVRGSELQFDLAMVVEQRSPEALCVRVDFRVESFECDYARDLAAAFVHIATEWGGLT